MTTKKLPSFDEDRQRAVQAFAHTMIVVDDEADHGHPESVSDLTEITEPRRTDAPAEFESSKPHSKTRISHPLDQKALIDSALELGLVCAVMRPDGNQDIKEKVAKAAERSDIVSLDWQMNDDGEKAISAINEIIQRDGEKGGRLRLIAIYTGVNDRVKILNDILNSIPIETRESGNIRIIDEEEIASDNGLRIIWLFKSGGRRLPGTLAKFQVAENKLAKRLQKEFS